MFLGILLVRSKFCGKTELKHTMVTCLFNPAFDFWTGRLISLKEKKKITSPTYDSLPSSAWTTVTIPANLALCSLYKQCNPSNTAGRDSLETLSLYRREIFIQVLNWFQKGHLSAKVLWSTVNWVPVMWKIKMCLAENAQKALGIPIPPLRELVRLKPPKVVI